MAASTPENPNGSFKSLFGRFFGLLGDDLGHRHVWVGGPNGRVVASTRKDIVTSAAGSNGAGAVTISGANVGDLVIGVANVTDGSDALASFEASISVAGQIQQTDAANLSAKKLVFYISRQS